jgi:hypothetical protein
VGSGDGARSSELLEPAQCLVRGCCWLRVSPKAESVCFGTVVQEEKESHSTAATATVVHARCEENYLFILPRPADCCSSNPASCLAFSDNTTLALSAFSL